MHDLLREQAVAIVTLAVRVHRDIRSATAVVVADGGFVMALRRPLLGAEAVAARLADGSWIDGAELRVIDEDLGAVVLRFDLAAAGTIPPRSAGIAGALPAPVYCLGDPLGIGLTVRETELHTAAAAPRRASSVPPPLTVGCQCPAGDVVLSVTGALQGIALGCDAAPGPRSERGLLLPVPALAALLQRARTTTPTPVPGLGSPPF